MDSREDADLDTAALLLQLGRLGLASSVQLQAALGVSQPTASRLLARAAPQVVALGRGKRSRYALPQDILGAAAQQPLHWVDAQGRVERLGTLTALVGQRVHLQVGPSEWLTQGRMPWWLTPLMAEGFLGRALARRLHWPGLADDPSAWTPQQHLFAALHQPDAPGAVVLGEVSAPQPLVATDADLDSLADRAAIDLPTGSSAGGEQPKFLAHMEPVEVPAAATAVATAVAPMRSPAKASAQTQLQSPGQPVLVKFSPPRGTPFGERWHDLLHLEQLALQVLGEHGVPVAAPRVVLGARRTHLVSPRFDRVGERGRLHVVALGAVHDAFVPVARQHWAATCEQLVAQRRLPPEAAAQVHALRQFGRLIGNTDMHFGNLSLRVDRDDLARGRFTLAPVYDMLPMRWRPDTSSGELGLLPFTPEPVDLQGPARPLAHLFWLRASALGALSPGFRQLARTMAQRSAGP